MNKIYKCNNCGFCKESIFDEDLICPFCGENLQVEIDDEDELITHYLEEDEIEQMKERIKIDGSDNVWTFIENIKNPFARASERGVFFKSGGKIIGKEINL